MTPARGVQDGPSTSSSSPISTKLDSVQPAEMSSPASAWQRSEVNYRKNINERMARRTKQADFWSTTILPARLTRSVSISCLRDPDVSGERRTLAQRTDISGLYDPMRQRCVPARTYSEGKSGSVDDVAVTMMLACPMLSRRGGPSCSSGGDSMPVDICTVGKSARTRSHRACKRAFFDRLKMAQVWMDGYAVRKSDT